MKQVQVVVVLSIFLLSFAGIVAAQQPQVVHASGAYAFSWLNWDSGWGQLQVNTVSDGSSRNYLYFYFSSYLPDGNGYVNQYGSAYISPESFVAKAKSAHLQVSGFNYDVCTQINSPYSYTCESATGSIDLEFTQDPMNYNSEVFNRRIAQSGLDVHTTGKQTYSAATVNGTFMRMPLQFAQGNIGYQRDTEITVTKTNGSAPATLVEMKLDSQEVLSHFRSKPSTLRKGEYTFTSIDYPNAAFTRAWGINDVGTIAGSYAMPGQPQRGFILVKGAFIPLDVPNAYMTQARGINNAGQVVGVYRDIDDWGLYGFLYANGIFTKIVHPTLQGDNYAMGIASDGTVVGQVIGESSATGFVWKNGVFSTYSCGEGTYTQFQGVAANGTIVGNCDPDPATYWGLFGTMGSFKQYLPPGVFAFGFSGVNASGIMVGGLQETDPDSISRGFVFDGKNLQMIEYPGASTTNVRGINAAGQIVGSYNSGAHGYIASPGNIQKPF